MTETTLQAALNRLSRIQLEAVEWQEGSMLVLAGPRSGKTQALTCRVGRILESSRDRRFRVLALTFTNKAAREMTQRVSTFVPDLDDRATIGTFHSFCVQVLRQHGATLGSSRTLLSFRYPLIGKECYGTRSAEACTQASPSARRTITVSPSSTK